jgi:hypothetical protein
MAASFKQNSTAYIAQKSCRFSLPANQTLTAGTATILNYSSATTNNATAVYVNNGSGRVTVTEAGVYLITAGVVVTAQVGIISNVTTAIYRNAQIVASIGDRATLAVNDSIGQTTSTIIQLSANDIIDVRTLVNQVVNGVGNGLANAAGQLLGSNAVQVNHLGITKLER